MSTNQPSKTAHKCALARPLGLALAVIIRLLRDRDIIISAEFSEQVFYGTIRRAEVATEYEFVLQALSEAGDRPIVLFVSPDGVPTREGVSVVIGTHELLERVLRQTPEKGEAQLFKLIRAALQRAVN